MTATDLTPHRPASAALTALAALGVVYGDIGTSPLYAMREAAKAAAAGVALTAGATLAATSAIIWALIVIVALKYALLILRADNKGEGGIMAMLALLHTKTAGSSRRGKLLLAVGLIGAALLYGDGVITPAVSVLSAVEGLKDDAASLAPLVLPITLGILVGLFWMQRFGTGRIGRIFGPIMVLWFAAIAVLGAMSIATTPMILAALNPLSGLTFFTHAPLAIDAALLGAAFLAVTGGEAMYADLGHFGAPAIRLAWFALVLPALLLNYLGQGALLLRDPAALANPFYQLVPDALHYPMVIFATAATVIASQSIISGAFSLTAQAIQLGFFPRMLIRHTDKASFGQVYLPSINTLLGIGTITAVLLFGSSDALAGAYGIAVSALMIITTVLATLIARQWGHSWAILIPVNGLFLIIDASFFTANSVKLFQGGWFPLTIAAVVAFIMLTWREGERLVEAKRAVMRPDETSFASELSSGAVVRTPGAAAFLSSAVEGIPLSLARVRALTQAVPEKILIVSILPVEEPSVPESERTTLSPIGTGLTRALIRYGFAEGIDVPAALLAVQDRPLLHGIDLASMVYYVGREAYLPDRALAGMAVWREELFATMHRNVEQTAVYFCVPADRVIEIGTEIGI